MSISLRESIDNIIPREWDVTPNSFDFLNDCYQEAKQMGFINGDEKEYCQIHYGAKVASYFWCKSNDNMMKFAGHFIINLILFDDYLDFNEKNDEKAKEVVKRFEFILLEGKLPNNPSKLERYTLFTRDLAFKYSDRRIDCFDAFISYFIDWSNSVIPLAKLSDIKSVQPSQIQNYIRNVNIGIDICQGVSFILFKNQMVDISLLINPRYRKLVNIASMVTGYINDIVSYSKEVNAGCGNTNILSILQNGENGLSLKEAFNNLCDKIDQLIKEFQYHEAILTKSIPNQLIIFIEHLKHFIKGTYIFSLSSKRYITSNSPFIELHKSVESLNDKIIKENLKQ